MICLGCGDFLVGGEVHKKCAKDVADQLATYRLQSDIRPIDAMIGKLDRLLSEFLAHADDSNLDEADRQTLKHHADDLIGVGNAALKKLGFAK